MTTTKNITRKEFLASTNIPTELVNAVIRQFGGWSSFKESALDVCRGGIDGGFHGFIYTAETVAFAKRNRNAIAELAKSQAEDFGQSTIAIVAGFNCLKDRKPSEDEIGRCLYGAGSDDQILNALAWYAGEEVCREYERMTEN